ncbi:MAG: FxsA family protein, partial [Hyphomicrobiales bacterium]|nr:FxsA family protein [Hyphomicrobiales bacterium]
MTEQANDRARGGLRMGWLVALWVVLEIAAFSWVAGRIGLFGALALTLGASMLGLYRLKVVGLAAATALRGSFAGGAPRPGGLLDG